MVGDFPFSTTITHGTIGGQYSVAHAINERGQVAGEASTPELHDNRAFLYYRGGEFSSATDINDHGQVVGFASGPAPAEGGTGWQKAFIYASGKMRDLNKMIDRPAAG